MQQQDSRRHIPRTDTLLALPEVAGARSRVAGHVIMSVIRSAQERARAGEISPEEVEAVVVAELAAATTSTQTPVLNATGVVVHTNLGRAPLSPVAVEALILAAGYVDVELDLDTGTRSKRGRGTRAAL
ncbi:MAG TPA: L-seryl-tRNA(Sec) selenium transferase, partial [Gordonia sp. (in: high G+C Gram-positive bacteria)]|nr:L-seryl-tRNA(Sec) selenium transferase [Gordonia sp. (in: high G+C Gram-positive bacteria)]